MNRTSLPHQQRRSLTRQMELGYACCVPSFVLLSWRAVETRRGVDLVFGVTHGAHPGPDVSEQRGSCFTGNDPQQFY